MAKHTLLYRSLHPEHSDRLLFAGAAAFAVHTAVIIGVGFDVEPREPRQLNSLNVSLVVAPTEDAPDDTTDVALANQRGGNEDERTVARAAPSPAPIEAPPAPIAQAPPPGAAPPGEDTVTEAPAEAPPAPTESVIAVDAEAAPRKTSDTPAPPAPVAAPTAEATPEPEPKVAAAKQSPVPLEPAPRLDTATLLAQARTLAATDARRDAQADAQARGTREAVVTASTREHRLAAYMEAWRQKVERVGNLNYPDEARRNGITGSLLLDVEIAPTGEVSRLRLLRSSGHRVLDKAAARIVTLAAPFAAFPKDIARDYDVIHIQRTWRFSVVGLKAG